MNISYIFSVFYFSLMALFLLFSGVWIFIEKIGLSIDSIIRYYAGSTVDGITEKSLYGQLEVMVPHLGAMGLFIMVTIHFLVFTPLRRKKYFLLFSTGVFITAFLNIVSGMVVSFGIEQFAAVKLTAFVLFSLFSFTAIMLLVVDLLKTLRYESSLE